MADNHWINADGGDWSTGANWSLGHAPDATENALFDCAFNASKTVTVDATAYSLNMDWTGATNSPNLAFSALLYVSGSIVFETGMTTSGGGAGKGIIFVDGGSRTLRSNGVVIATYVELLDWQFTGTITLLDALTIAGGGSTILSHEKGALDTNGQTVTCGTFQTPGNTLRALTLGASTINCTAFDASGSNLTITANTSTIKVTGTGAFTGNGKTYNNVELNGTAHTISGNNTFASLKFGPAGAQAITYTDGSTQTVGAMSRTGTGVITFQGSGAAGWNITKTGYNEVRLYNMSISRSAALPLQCWYAASSTDGSNNSGWLFAEPPKGVAFGAGF